MRFPHFGRPVASVLPLSAILCAALISSGCSDDDDDDDNDDAGASTTETLSLHFTGLENLGPDFVYEGWVKADGGAPVTTGRFTINDMGVMSQTMFEIDADVAAAADTFILTIEPYDDPDAGPAATKVLAGDFDDLRASLHVEHGAALGDTFETAEGTFFLATPTSAASDDGNYGIWFKDGVNDAPGLTLPTLPDGWKYEGWVVIDGKPFSTGTFTATDMADDDEAGPYAGDGGFPSVPGQDFVERVMLNLEESTVVISIEPDADNSPAPFAMKPLILKNIDGGSDQQYLETNLSSLPTGSAIWGETEILTLELDELADLGPAAVYEGWIAGDDGVDTTGRFMINADGKMSQTEFPVPAAVAAGADTFILTIEPHTGDDPAPAATHVLAGDFSDAMALLDVDHESALGDTFESVAGTFFLATPTSSATDDGDYGIWFKDGENDAPGLTLPTLPSGWKYEGWVVVGGMPYSTGTFTATDVADDDGPGPYAGDLPMMFPDVPGQDFVDGTMLNLAGSTVVISIEPDEDNSDAPFSIKPLVLEDIASGNAQQTLGQNLDSLPTGAATLGEVAMPTVVQPLGNG